MCGRVCALSVTSNYELGARSGGGRVAPLGTAATCVAAALVREAPRSAVNRGRMATRNSRSDPDAAVCASRSAWLLPWLVFPSSCNGNWAAMEQAIGSRCCEANRSAWPGPNAMRVDQIRGVNGNFLARSAAQ